MHKLLQGDCLQVLGNSTSSFDCIFADPFDNLGLGYDGFNDSMPHTDYVDFLRNCVICFSKHSPIVWLSFNAKYTFAMGGIFQDFLFANPTWEGKPCVQTFTFGQHNHSDLGNCHRPLWRLNSKNAIFYPDQIRIKSWRQEHGDPRADPRGRVPGDVFAFPRVTGNSRQRRSYHPTQLNEGLVRRCIEFSTAPGGTVLDPFAGTATTLRVCKGYNRQATLIELSSVYCAEIVKEHGMSQVSSNEWELHEPKAWWLP